MRQFHSLTARPVVAGVLDKERFGEFCQLEYGNPNTTYYRYHHTEELPPIDVLDDAVCLPPFSLLTTVRG